MTIDHKTAKAPRTVPDGQTPLDDKLNHRLLDVIREGEAARDAGTGSPYHGHSLEHCLHATGWVARDLRLALNESQARAKKAEANLHHVIQERDATFALMLARAEKAEAERDRVAAEWAEVSQRNYQRAKSAQADHDARVLSQIDAVPAAQVRAEVLEALLADDEMCLRLAEGYDREDAAQRGEPSPHTMGDEGYAEWAADRIACAEAGLRALIEKEPTND